MNIYIVTEGANNAWGLQFAFNDAEEALKCRDRLDKDKGASRGQSSVHVLPVYSKCDDVIKAIEDEKKF